MGPSEMILLPVALRQLEPHSELETVQYCSFWWAVALHVPWRHEKISSAPQLQIAANFGQRQNKAFSTHMVE